LRKTVPTIKKAVNTAKSDANSDIKTAISQQILAKQAAKKMERKVINYSRGTHLKYNTARGYINIIINIYHSQIALGLHNYSNPRDMRIKAYLKKIQAGYYRRIRIRHKDRVIKTILDNITHEKLRKFVYKY
jgi:hypothetical protein